MPDKVESVGNSLIQHGRFNDRIYLMHLSPSDHGTILDDLERIVRVNRYSKVFAKIPSCQKEDFLSFGYREEAYVPGFFSGKEDASFMCKYFTKSRMLDEDAEGNKKVLQTAFSKNCKEEAVQLDGDASCMLCTEDDVVRMGEIYGEVFATYPFPIYDPSYLLKTMSEDILYFCIKENGRIVALASCEMDLKNRNVEMTDFATLPECRGKGYSQYLLNYMEKEMSDRGMLTYYTIARAGSFGMNIVFSRNSYEYAGTLLKNTNIAGKLESMNIWYKSPGKQ
ncbi:putative beta-lysine N-acetyltransferase [Methanolobus halotolerans]|uniref:Putative beta-lysine N-acetyltransferase n=1 Tax=Methanolobus halotolerans TaxID=2052935 RepID=A0A4E0Q222_9EURY|nr:putative beta-lysine N-acetyltransferase [Methanolobus halotolerans]TGC11155.1 putative beta-lysine N-acetyltransferase [Methanolobus halotolerans]